jgi:Fe-Mn family superoxide dismutase
MDTWEHAFMIDYGTDKKSYINAFLDNVNWKVMEDRLNSALMASDMLGKATE